MVESVTALRNLHAAPKGASTHHRRKPPAEERRSSRHRETLKRDGAARPAASNGNKRQRPNPRPDLKWGRDDDGRASAGGATPGHTELIEEKKRRLKALSQRYPGQLELRAPLGATPLNLRMQAQTAARFEDILAHVTLTGAGSRDSRLLPIWDQTRVWDPGDEPPLKRAGACGRPPNKPAAASGPGGRWGSVVFGWRALRPSRVVFIRGCVSCNKFSHFRQT
jgi:hypothetical protein